MLHLLPRYGASTAMLTCCVSCICAAAVSCAESVTQLFAKYGDVVMVRICSRGGTGKLPSWLNKAVEDINMGVGHGEFALIEFGTEDECVACVTKTKNLDNW
jgi:hypothetical protein